MSIELLDTTFTTPVTGSSSDVVNVPGGARSLHVLGRLDWVSGGTTAKAWVQSSIDGSTWHDLIAFAFGTATEARVSRVSGTSGLVPTVATDASLADNTIVDGPIGDQFRVKYTTTGTYGAGTRLQVHMIARA